MIIDVVELLLLDLSVIFSYIVSVPQTLTAAIYRASGLSPLRLIFSEFPFISRYRFRFDIYVGFWLEACHEPIAGIMLQNSFSKFNEDVFLKPIYTY
jgi:hypothetical protein